MDELLEHALWALDHPLELAAVPWPSNPYIAPDGAMQFEVSMASSEPDKPLDAFVCWVRPGKLLKASICWQGCSKGWPIVLDSLDPERRAHCTLIPNPCVCECNGRFIE